MKIQQTTVLTTLELKKFFLVKNALLGVTVIANPVSCHQLLDLFSFSCHRSTLSRCCNAPSFLFTTQKNTPLGTKLKYEVDTSGIFHINQEIFKMFPKVPLPICRISFTVLAALGTIL